jgi:hypothetical protein
MKFEFVKSFYWANKISYRLAIQYTQLSIEQCASYDTVKEVILNCYELPPVAYRQKFRNCKRVVGQFHVAFARIKEQLFDRWFLSRKVGKHYDYLR